ncbi:anti-sigma factor antagonist [Streptomyces sp. NPDC012510]|uniref:STAS domain-containing protein n=1 Tax=Streptomyces sp. NPDC012510 TaxID=3364838 RepID=UPI0036F0FF18
MDDQEKVAPGHLSVNRTDVDGITVLDLRGEIDYQSVGALTRALPPEDPTTGDRVVVDLSRVTFMDSSGVSALIAAHQATQSAQGWLRLAGAGGAVLRTVRLVGLDAVVTCHPTLREALVP